MALKIIKTRHLSAWYGVTGTIKVYSDGTARLRAKQYTTMLHNKIHKNEKAAMSAWYRLND